MPSRNDGRFRTGHRPQRTAYSGKVQTEDGWEYPEGFATPITPGESTTIVSFRITTSQKLRLQELVDNAQTTQAKFLRNLIDALHKASHTNSSGTAP